MGKISVRRTSVYNIKQLCCNKLYRHTSHDLRVDRWWSEVWNVKKWYFVGRVDSCWSVPGGEPGSILKRISATLHIIVATLHWPLSPHYSNGTIAGIIPQLVLLLFLLSSTCSGCSYLLIHKLFRGIFYFFPIFIYFRTFRVKCGTWRALSLNSLRQHGLVVTMINMFMVVVVMFIICPLISTESPDINFNTTYHSK